jgi:hypothetical protein
MIHRRFLSEHQNYPVTSDPWVFGPVSCFLRGSRGWILRMVEDKGNWGSPSPTPHSVGKAVEDQRGEVTCPSFHSKREVR